MVRDRADIWGDNKGLSSIVAGCWRLLEQTGGDDTRIEKFVTSCIELGITSFDHADVYGGFTCEEMFGRLLRRKPSLRQKIEIITKCGVAPPSAKRPENRNMHYHLSAEHISRSVDASLAALQTDYIDLLLLHRPDLLMDAAEVAEQLSRTRECGKVRHVGVSNFSASQLSLLQSKAEFRLVTNQIEISLIQTAALHDGTLDFCQQKGVRPMAWSPLGGGCLGGKGQIKEELWSTLCETAKQYEGATPATIALAWLLRLPSAPIPIVGTVDVARLRQATLAPSIKLDRQDWYRLYASAGHKVP